MILKFKFQDCRKYYVKSYCFLVQLSICTIFFAQLKIVLINSKFTGLFSRNAELLTAIIVIIEESQFYICSKILRDLLLREHSTEQNSDTGLHKYYSFASWNCFFRSVQV